MDGAVVLDKPQGMTSHAAVVAARRLLAERRVGHLGTLDPFSTGVLVLLAGQATRLVRFYRDREKTYHGLIRFGYSTDTFDGTGAPTSPRQEPILEGEPVRLLFRDFLGTYLQQPPPYSAKKVAGVPAYRLARKGQHVPLAPTPVTIHELDVLSVRGSAVEFRARVSSGTYVRSLAHDLGQRLGVGAHLLQLRRTAVGEFGESSAVSLEHLEDTVRRGQNPLLPPENLLPEFPAVTLSVSASRSARHGNPIEVKSQAKWVKLLEESGRLLGIAEHVAGSLYHPVVVLDAARQGLRNPTAAGAGG